MYNPIPCVKTIIIITLVEEIVDLLLNVPNIHILMIETLYSL